MNDINSLPNISLKANSGSLTTLFLDGGIRDFHGACHFVKSLPYGPTESEGDSRSLFREGRGTCTAKHGVIARLGEELDLSVCRVVGFYRLTEQIMPGVEEILRQAALPFIPNIHCFLQYQLIHVDLTEGNSTGKSSLPDTYDIIVRVPTELSGVEEKKLYSWALAYYCTLFPELRKVGAGEIKRARELSRNLWLRRPNGAGAACTVCGFAP